MSEPAFRKIFGVFIFLVGFHYSFGQYSFSFGTKLLKGEDCILADFDNETGIVLTGSLKLYIIESNLTVVEITSYFENYDLSKVTSMAVVEPSVYFVGTSEQGLLKYSKGQITRLGTTNGINSLNINTIKKSNQTHRHTFVATNNGLYSSADNSQFKIIDNSFFNASRFQLFEEGVDWLAISKSGPKLCGNMIGDQQFAMRDQSFFISSTTTKASLTTTEQIKDVVILCKSAQCQNTNTGTYVIYGSNLGVRWHDTNTCLPQDNNINTIVTNINVNDFLNLSPKGYDLIPTLFISHKQGLSYISNVSEYISSQTIPKVTPIDQFAGSVVYSTHYTLCNNRFYAATESGIVQFYDDRILPEIKDDFVTFGLYKYCPGKTVRLSVPEALSSEINWYKDKVLIPELYNRLIMLASSPGDYSVVYKNCFSEREFRIATLYPDTTLDVQIHANEKYLCPDSWIQLAGRNSSNTYNDELTYYWYRGDSLKKTGNYEYIVNQPGNYHFKAVNCNGYTFNSDTVVISGSTVPRPVITTRNYYCEGDTLKILNQKQDISIKWHYTASKYHTKSYLFKSFFTINPDTIPEAVVFTGNDGCESRVNLMITPDHIIRTGQFLNRFDTIFLGPIDNRGYLYYLPVKNYIYKWPDGYMGNSHYLTDGSHIIRMINEQEACKTIYDSVVVTRLFPLRIEGLELSFFPNPVTNLLILNIDFSRVENIILSDIAGNPQNVPFYLYGSKSTSVSMANNKPGIYLIEVHLSDATTKRIKILKI